MGASASVRSVADSYDNAMAEALNGTFKAELIEHQGPWRDFDEVERAVFAWIGWYNDERRTRHWTTCHPTSTKTPTGRARPAGRLNKQDRALRNPGQLIRCD
ncbi:integrase core domain-containing protein [Saccharopolyspora shandongensis]|uniref:integrase core domain-containing protein n=1 Tax=Saccharopolyspora shandongensis TaxID=418495 RepID=UPI0033F4739F